MWKQDYYHWKEGREAKGIRHLNPAIHPMASRLRYFMEEAERNKSSMTNFQKMNEFFWHMQEIGGIK
jgi:hypothetical protein